MAGRGIASQLAHVAEHGDAPAGHIRGGEGRKRGAHGIGARVVGVVDNGEAPAGGDDLLAAGLGHRISQRSGDGGQIEPQGEAHRGGGAGVVHVVGAGEGE